MKRFLALMLACALLFCLAACGKTDDPAPTNSGTEEPTTAPTAESTPDPAEEDHTFETAYWAGLAPTDPVSWNAPHDYKKVGLIVPDGTNEFYVGIANNCERILNESGYELVWTGIGQDPQAAITAIETWVTQGVDALIVMAQDTSCEAATLKAMEQGVLVVLGSAEFESYHVYCTQDYYDIGWQTAEMAANWLTENYGDDVKYITIGGQKAEFQTLKTNGVNEGMEHFYPNGECVAQLINETSEKLVSDVETLLTQNPDIQAVVSWHATMTMTALNTAKSIGFTDPNEFFIFGSQMTAQSALEIADPNSCYVADTWMGDQGMQYAEVVLTLLNGGTVNHNDYAPPFVVNADNIDTYYEDYYAWLDTLS